MNSITAIIMTYNEEKNISRSILSIKDFAERIIVLDSGSTDRTIEIAKELGAETHYNKFEYYAKQFNWGLDNLNIQTDWVLRLDADEEIPDALKREIEKHLKNNNPEINGFTFEADLYFLGKKIRCGVRKKRKLMLFRTGIGRIEDKRRDAHSIISKGKSISLKNRFIHYDFKDISNFIEKYNAYATREMLDYIDYLKTKKNDDVIDPLIAKQRKKKYGLYYKFPKFLRAKLWFIYNYYFRLGFLDGKPGYIFHYLECYWYRMLVDTKIFEQNIK